MGEPDEALIRQHWERASGVLVPMIARFEPDGWRHTPEGRAVVEASPEVRPSIAVAALAGPRSGWTAAIVTEVRASDQWPAELVRSLVRSTIAWNVPSAELAIRLVAATEFDHERVQLAVRASDHVAGTRPGDPRVLDALALLQRRVEETPDHRYRVLEMRARVRAAIARHTPPELLDLSPVSTDDCWGPPARRVLTEADGPDCDAAAVLRLLSAASTTASTPSTKWRRSAAEVLAGRRERRLVRDLVRLLVDLELDATRPFVAKGNDGIARAAVWALAIDPALGTTDTHGWDDVALVEAVVERCSRTNGQAYVTEALCGRAAGAAVVVLGELARRGSDEDDRALRCAAEEALERLWNAVDRVDVSKRIGRALGRSPEQLSAKKAEVERAKDIARRAEVNPRPAERQRLLRDVIRSDLAPRLAGHGFVERSGRTFRRREAGTTGRVARTDVVGVVTAGGMVQLRFGLVFTDRAERLRIDDCDIAAQLALTSSDGSRTPTIDGGTSEWLAHRTAVMGGEHERRARRGQDDPAEVLTRLVERFEAHGLPALERWSDPWVLADDLDHLEVPFPHGTLLHDLDLPGSAARTDLVNRLRTLAG